MIVRVRVDRVESVHVHVYNKYVEHYRGKGTTPQ